MQMFDDLKEKVKDWTSEEEVSRYLVDLLNKRAFDKAGLIWYGACGFIPSLIHRANVFKSM